MSRLMTGCTSTSTITEYDKDTGKVVKKTETRESVVEQVIASTQNKSVFVFREQYVVGVKAEPSEKMFDFRAVYEHSNTGVASILKEHTGLDTMNGIANIMATMKRTDSVSVSPNGIGSGSGSSTVNSSGPSGYSAAATNAAATNAATDSGKVTP